MAHADIENPVLTAAKGNKGRTVYALSFHSLRHTFNGAMANVGVSQEIRMKLTGHSGAMTNRGHTEAVNRRCKESLEVLLRSATQRNDFDIAIKIKEEITMWALLR